MDLLHANTVAELEQHLASFGDGYLFRGQTKAYNEADGSPVLNSSFARMGCVPPLMLKWSFYIRELLRRGGFDIDRHDAQHFNQGLLQHYGWRSFFVDLSASNAVAAWFASHIFHAKRGWDLCENSFEEPVMLGVRRAHYSSHEGTGNLYVLSKGRLEQNGHTLISLVDDLNTDSPTRYEAQRAWLASIFLEKRRLEPGAIAAKVTAPAEVFREFAASAGIASTNDLFPGPDKDKMLEQLLNLPRIKLDVPEAPLPFFLRSLEIPEYQDSFVKHLPPTVVLASPLWVSDTVQKPDDNLWLRVEEDTFYGFAEIDKPMPRLCAYFRENPVTHIETDGLICFPVVDGSRTYEKGIVVRGTGDGRFEVGSLTVDYSSDRLTAIGGSLGYTYALDEDRFVHSPDKDDCPCGDSDKHRTHLRALAVLEDKLGTAKIERRGHIVTMTS
jgi:hypothetical protein